MARGARKKGASAVVWALMALLVLGLGGFGVTNFGGTVRSIGSVGDRDIPVTEYARALSEEMEALSAQFGAAIPFDQAEQLGLVASVRAQVVAGAATAGEAARLGISVGDEAVRREVLRIPAFQGQSGEFDRAAYADTLRQSGLTEAAFETRIREQTAMGLLQGAVGAGFAAPAAVVDTIVAHLQERRSFTYVRYAPEALTAPLGAPDEAALTATYEADPAAYTTPETRKITYAWLTPEMIADSVALDETALRAEYDARLAEFVQPERRLVERLVFESEEAAAAAKARLDAGETDFDALVAERGLALTDIDLGEMSEAELGAAGAAVFALTEPGVTAPQPSDLGPALFRMNGILEAQETTFEEARETLAAEVALDRARRQVMDGASDIEDRLAGGATLEDIAAETDFDLGTIDYAAGVTEGIAAYDAFRQAAGAAKEGDFPELAELEDGGLFALRVDALTPPTLQPLDAVRDRVIDAWTTAETLKALRARAEADAAAAGPAPGAVAAGPGITVQTASALTRTSFTDGMPASVLDAAFGLTDSGESTVVEDAGAVWLVVLDDVQAADKASPDVAALTDRLKAQVAQGLATDALALFTSAVEGRAGVRIDQAAVNAVHAQFR